MKHWFVLYDTSLKFYRDSEAEEVGSIRVILISIGFIYIHFK